MSILLHPSTRVLAQGIQGRRSTLAIKASLDYGTHLVAAVSMGITEESIYGVPIYRTVHAAVAEHPVEVSVIFSSGWEAARDAVYEACDAKISVVVVMEERMPIHVRAEMVARCRRAGVCLIGPNSNGILSAGISKVGTIGGHNPSEQFLPGTVGIVSRSVGLAAEIGRCLKRNDIGVSTCVTMGGGNVVGTRMKAFVQWFLEDSDTTLVLVCGMPGTQEEEDLAQDLLQRPPQKPIVAFLAGRHLSGALSESWLGYHQENATVLSKSNCLERAGVDVVAQFDDIPGAILRHMRRSS